MEAILLTLIGIAAGVAATHFYDKRASRETQELADLMTRKFEALSSDLEDLGNSYQQKDPALAKKIQSIQRKHVGFEPGVFTEADTCPQCKKGSLIFLRYGPGQLGPQNAWYGCQSCDYRFQTQESFGD